MPRASKSTARTSIASKRTSKRNVSHQRDIYAIPDSPQSSVTSETDASTCTNENDNPSCRNPSPVPDTRGRSVSTASMKTSEDVDCTPTQAKPSRSRTASFEPNQFHPPGFEALEAVNGLYRKLRDSQDENEQLKLDNRNLTKEGQDYKKQIRNLQTELQAERDKTKAIQLAHEKSNQAAHKNAEENLNTVLTSLRNFSSAAYRLMPLLDVLTDAPDIQYDQATERLYEIMKQYNEQSERRNLSDVKTESSRPT